MLPTIMMYVHFFVLALCSTPCLLQSILQTPPMLVVKPNQPMKLNCTSTATGDPYMYWYRQPMSGGAFVFIVLSYSKGSAEKAELTGFKANRSKDKEAEFILESDKIVAEDAGVYYCAWSIDERQYFGSGTILTVLGENEKQVQPKVKIYLPNKKEFQEHELISLVCVASGFFPEHVRITWYINDEKIESLYQNVPKKEKDGKFSTSSRLSVTKSQYFNPDNKFRCEAAFVGEKNAASDEIQGELGCGISKESYGRYMNQGKISYIMVLFKSGLYAVIVLAVIWSRKVLLGSC